MVLLEIEKIDYEENNLTAVFDGLFREGFIVKADFEYEKEQVESKDDSLGLRDYFVATNISLLVEIYHEDEKISINDRELKKVLNQIELKLIDLLEKVINNN